MNLNSYTVTYLKNRGFSSSEEAAAFVDFSEASLRRVARMDTGKALLERLALAVERQEAITIYGDYDADGVMAWFILFAGLSPLLPGKVKGFANDRFRDGYTITPASMKKCLDQYPETQIILTCDNGIGAAEAVAYATSRGVTVLVTDHHEQGVLLPADCIAVDEKKRVQKEKDAAEGVLTEAFCGAELARRVITELYERLGIAAENQSFLDSLYAYAGFATITDSVPMNAANHYVARRGLSILKERQGLWGLWAEEAGIRAVTGDTVGFRYGPMINAASRMNGSSKQAMMVPYYGWLNKDAACRQAIRQLMAVNDERKGVSARDDATAMRKIEAERQSEAPFLLIWDESFSEGVNGLTAAHLVETFGVPAAVMAPTAADPEVYKGSARSVEGFNLFETLTAFPEYITAGGHPMAAGLTVRREHLPLVRQLLCEAAAEPMARRKAALAAADWRADLDFVFSPGELDEKEVQALAQIPELLDPFGPGLEPPRIGLCGHVADLFCMKEIHAKLVLKEPAKDGSRLEVVWWRHYEDAAKWFAPGKELRVVGRPQVNVYQGRTTIQFTAERIL